MRYLQNSGGKKVNSCLRADSGQIHVNYCVSGGAGGDKAESAKNTHGLQLKNKTKTNEA